MSSNQPVVDGLKKVLADSYTLYLKTQNYHWNVTGPHFRALHLMFEEQYTDLAAAVDEIAERIRALGEKAPGSYTAFSKLATLKEANDNADAMTMVHELEEDNRTLVRLLDDVKNSAEQAGDDATADMMIARQQVHSKNAWMLKATAA